MKILLAQLNPTIGAIQQNTQAINKALEFARNQGCELVVFPELAIPGYPPDDLLLLPDFITACEEALLSLIPKTADLTVILGTVRMDKDSSQNQLHNTTAIIENQTLIGFQDKTLLPTYDVFDEHRYFKPAQKTKLWPLCNHQVAITICEDIWHSHSLTPDHSDPLEELAPLHPDLLINCSASPYSYHKLPRRAEVLARGARLLQCPALLCNQVGGNDSLIFDGNSLVVSAQGNPLAQAKSLAEDLFIVDTNNLTTHPLRQEGIGSLYQALALGLSDYFRKSGFEKACLGLSGGIDSALVACLAVEALGPNRVTGVAMPSPYTSQESINDANHLAKNLDIELLSIPIDQPMAAYEALLSPLFGTAPPDVTEENIQARIRGMLLMALSNKHGMIVLATGNKSETATGYATLYGDMCGGLSVINDVTKQQVYALSRWINKKKPIIPQNILDKAPSAELRPGQKDVDSLPDYDVLDSVLEEYVVNHLNPTTIATKHGYPLDLVKQLIQRIHQAEYKRRQAPPGLRVSEKAFSLGRRFPIVQKWVT